MDISLIFACFVVGFVMIAGAGSNLNQAFGINENIGRIICALMIIIIGMMDFDKVSQVIGSFSPLIVVFVVTGAIFTIVTAKPDWQDLNSFAKSLPANFNNVGLAVIN